MPEDEPTVQDPQSYAVIGAAMQVHRVLQRGFLEAVYQEALAIELADRDIPYVREALFTIYYSGRRLTQQYRADFLCFEDLVVETKALGRLTSREEAQLLNYLKAAGLTRGLLIDFGGVSLEVRRFAL
jgi:GxxExxY protein